MHKLLLTALLTTSFFLSDAAFSKDTSFISYKEFSHLSKKEIKQRFGNDAESQKIISNYYKYNGIGLKRLWAIIPLSAIGVYFAVLGANATNGMGGTVGLVLAILFLLPALILAIPLLVSILRRKKDYSKMHLHRELKQYFQSRE